MSRTAPLPDNVAGALCYLAMPLSAVALLVIEPFNKRSFVRFHAWQAIFTCLAMIALTIGVRITAGVLGILPFVGRVLGGLLFFGLSFGFLALWLWLMMKALQGKRHRLPVIGLFASQASG